MTEAIPLPLLRIWCRKKDAWLSFRSNKQDYYFVNPSGYFVELPDRTLAPITARVSFPVVNCYPSIIVEELELQTGFSPPSYFVYALREGQVTGRPEPMRLSTFRHELDQSLPAANKLTPPEKYIAIRVLESGMVPEHILNDIINSLGSSNRTFGQELVKSGIVAWELLMGVCLDMRVPSKMDPPDARKSATLREWELAGEILIAMGKVTRTALEYALKMKREGSRSLGEILAAIGACSSHDVSVSLEIQQSLRECSKISDISLLGDLLVRRGVISQEELNEAMQRQRIASQPLEKVLVGIGACDQDDIENYRRMTGYFGFQGQIDDQSLGHWLIKNNCINEHQLRQAMDIQFRGRQFLGEILIAMGKCSHEQISNTVNFQQGVRQAQKVGSDKLGDILMAQGKVGQDQLEKAIGLQSNGRRPLGEILTAIGGCSEQDISTAVTLQKQWRERVAQNEDRIGEVLTKRGFLTEEGLEQAIAIHTNTGKPIGRVLVEEEFCTPEEIIATMVLRDYKRQTDLHKFLKQGLRTREQVQLPGPQEPDGEKKDIKTTTERLLSAWFKKPSAPG